MIEIGTECVVVQRTVEGCDPEMSFGPLTTTLSQLFKQGYHLRAVCYKVNKTKWSEKIHLVKNREKWLVGKVPRHWFINPQGLSLSDHIKNGQQLAQCASFDHRDPLDQLMLAYPVKRKPKQVMVGNQTLAEFVRQELKEMTI